jgi:hypothetical protein
MDPITLLAAFAPLAVDFGKSLISRFIAPEQFKPATIEQYTQVKQLDLDMFKALNEAGGSNASYLWVEAIVRLQRPLVVAIALGAWAYTHVVGIASPEVDNFAAIVGFYLFGDRTMFYAKNGIAK